MEKINAIFSQLKGMYIKEECKSQITDGITARGICRVAIVHHDESLDEKDNKKPANLIRMRV